ncbi:MAG: bifunctional 2-polyprenyl-6-hydroxyphenol methylase/3-demethylubiquinol 3-O-methyltransferase UbiG [Bdellovibrionota bacterium]
MADINNSIYETLGERWYEAWDDPVALLRAESKIKHQWILERIEGKAEVLDVGCGAGFLANEFADKGFAVTGVDLSGESLKVAQNYDKTGSVKYLEADALHLPFPDQSFDVVTCMDFLEHVENPEKYIKEISRVLRPQGLFFFHTFNRNPISWLFIIKSVEWLVKNTPKHMHVIQLFIKPSELSNFCRKAGMETIEMTGIRPVFRSIPLKSVFSGVVPRSFRFQLTRSLLLSYMGFARKTL